MWHINLRYNPHTLVRAWVERRLEIVWMVDSVLGSLKLELDCCYQFIAVKVKDLGMYCQHNTSAFTEGAAEY